MRGFENFCYCLPAAMPGSIEIEVDVVLWLFSEQHLYYVFCLLKLDGQVLDTALVETDESETDVSFDNVIVL